MVAIIIKSRTLILLFLLFYSYSLSKLHPKSKCSLECYALCMQSGTPHSSICNCVPARENPVRNCTILEEQFASAAISNKLPKTKTEYLDAHMIKVVIEPISTAFAYIFEYSTISSKPLDWIFAGASSKPEAIFSILDPCRDYQFRVLIILRSSNPMHILEIVRPQPIPVTLPPFVLTQKQISIELPQSPASSSVNSTIKDELKLYVKWSLPTGFIDGDIYGYESPALYPIQCSTPEAELAQPRIEIVKGGGRLAVSLPASILEARCRMWVEVRMLPRCVRLEPFNIQKNIEIDCSKNTEMEICSKDLSPVCFETVDISGDHGKVRISWPKPENRPLYYHVRYGPAHTKGTIPFVSWQLAAKREVRVDGSLNSFALDIPEDEDFGVQVCAILSKKRKRPKFGVVQVIPFQCSSCKPTQKTTNLGCSDCAIIIGSTVNEKDWLDKKIPTKAKEILNEAKIYRMETDLAVNSRHSIAKSDTRHSTDSPIELEKAEEINQKNQETTTELPTSSSTTPLNEEIVEKEEMRFTSTTPATSSLLEVQQSTEKMVDEIPEIRKLLSEKIEQSMENLEQVLNDTAIGEQEPSQNMDPELEMRLEEAAKQLQDTLTNLVGNSTELRHHQQSKKCLTSDGIICEFGCENRKMCFCPTETHARLQNGKCINRDTMMNTICFPSKEINATWDADSGNIMIRRADAVDHIENAENVDKLFVEFGKVKITTEPPNENRTKIEFDESKNRNKIVVLIQTVLKSSVFSIEPFIFHVNESIDLNTNYGMRFCVFNSSQIKNPHQYNWDDASLIAPILQLSPVKFTNKLQMSSSSNRGATYWSTVATVAKISILVALAIAMFILIYLNCTKIRTLYDRKRTHYFRPFYIDPSIHLSSSISTSSRNLGTGLKREPTRGYYDVRSSHLMM